MSKLIKLLEQLGKDNPPPLGFGIKNIQKPNPPMVLLVSTENINNLKDIDVSFLDGILFATKNPIGPLVKSKSSPLTNIPWGVLLHSPTEQDVSELQKLGCDFVTLTNLEVGVEATKEEELGHFLIMTSELSKDDQQALSGLPIDGIIFDKIAPGPLTLEELLRLSRFRKEISKAFILKIQLIPTLWELECLHNIGVDGLLVDIEETNKIDLSTLHDRILGLPKKLNQRDTMVPSIRNLSYNESDHSQEEYDDDDDDDDQDDQ